MKREPKPEHTSNGIELRGYTEQLEAASGDIHTILLDGAKELVSAIADQGASEAAQSSLKGSVDGIISWLQRAIGETVETLTESNRQTAKQSLKAQAASFEMKVHLQHGHTPARLALPGCP